MTFFLYKTGREELHFHDSFRECTPISAHNVQHQRRHHQLRLGTIRNFVHPMGCSSNLGHGPSAKGSPCAAEGG